jgi:hypothetical protein
MIHPTEASHCYECGTEYYFCHDSPGRSNTQEETCIKCNASYCGACIYEVFEDYDHFNHDHDNVCKTCDVKQKKKALKFQQKCDACLLKNPIFIKLLTTVKELQSEVKQLHKA